MVAVVLIVEVTVGIVIGVVDVEEERAGVLQSQGPGFSSSSSVARGAPLRDSTGIIIT